MGLYKKLDLWSIIDHLDTMVDYDYNGNEKESPYWDYYSEQIRELCILASDMWQEIQELKNKLWYKLPNAKLLFVMKTLVSKLRLPGSILQLPCCLIQICRNCWNMKITTTLICLKKKQNVLLLFLA